MLAVGVVDLGRLSPESSVGVRDLDRLVEHEERDGSDEGADHTEEGEPAERRDVPRATAADLPRKGPQLAGLARGLAAGLRCYSLALCCQDSVYLRREPMYGSVIDQVCRTYLRDR